MPRILRFVHLSPSYHSSSGSSTGASMSLMSKSLPAGLLAELFSESVTLLGASGKGGAAGDLTVSSRLLDDSAPVLCCLAALAALALVR